SRFIDELDPQYLDINFKPQQQESQKTSFGNERRARGQKTESFSKPKPKILPKTTSELLKAHVPTPVFAPSDTNNLHVGMEVEHVRFGFEKVVNMEGKSPELKATVFFKELGQKQLLLKYAKLRIVE